MAVGVSDYVLSLARGKKGICLPMAVARCREVNVVLEVSLSSVGACLYRVVGVR